MNCPQCSYLEASFFCEDEHRPYYQCPHCDLVFVPRNKLLSPEEEKSRYDCHENSIENPEYLNYIRGIYNSFKGFLKPSMKGLDFGCGMAQAFAFVAENMEVVSHDPFYFPNEAYQNSQYDFIILSEVIEHLSTPGTVIKNLSGLLTPSGKLFIKTMLYPPSSKEFNRWFYKNDLTHVQFYSEKTFKILAEMNELHYKGRIGKDLYFLAND